MAITRKRKENLVEQYEGLLDNARGIIMASYSGLTVKQLQALRGQIREMGAEFHVVKNSLALRAFETRQVPVPDGAFEGTTAVGFTQQDVPALAKAIVDLAKDSETVQLKGGIVDGVVYNSAQVEMLASLPPLPVLQARLLGVINAPAARVAGALAGAVRQLVNVTNAYAESDGVPAEA